MFPFPGSRREGNTSLTVKWPPSAGCSPDHRSAALKYSLHRVQWFYDLWLWNGTREQSLKPETASGIQAPRPISRLHPFLSSQVIHTLHTHTHATHTHADRWRNTRPKHAPGDIVLLCWPWNVQTVWRTHKTLFTLVDKQCMIHKASKRLERVTAGERVCVFAVGSASPWDPFLNPEDVMFVNTFIRLTTRPKNVRKNVENETWGCRHQVMWPCVCPVWPRRRDNLQLPDGITSESTLTFASKNLRRSRLSFGTIVFLMCLYRFRAM